MSVKVKLPLLNWEQITKLFIYTRRQILCFIYQNDVILLEIGFPQLKQFKVAIMRHSYEREPWPSGTVLACGAGDPGSNPLRTKT